MSYCTKKFVLNDLYECWRIQKYILFNKFIFDFNKKNFWTLTPKNQFCKVLG
jgi:hypothetical protein